MRFSVPKISALIFAAVLLTACGGSSTASDSSSISEAEAEELYDWCLENRPTPIAKCGLLIDQTVEDVMNGHADRKCAIRFIKEYVIGNEPYGEHYAEIEERHAELWRSCFSESSLVWTALYDRYHFR